MAGFNKDDRKNLNKIANNFGSEHIKVPTGDNSAEEIAYSTTDLILGIAAVGMFGTQFKSTKSSNISSILNQKSFLANINDYIKSTINDKDTNNTSIRVSIVNTPTVSLNDDSIKRLIENINQSSQNNATAKILLSIDNSSNLNELNKALKELLNTVDDNEKIGNSIKNILELIESIDNIGKLFGEIDKNHYDLKIDNVIDEILNVLNPLSDSEFTKKMESSNKNISKLISKNSLLDNIKIFLSNIDIAIKGLENIDNVKGIGELLNAIINLSQFNSEINEEALYKLSYVVSDNGPISNIINDIKLIGNKAIGNNTISAIRNIQSFIDSIKTMTEIGLMDKIRIMTNVFFFKHYINKVLPALIADVEKSFTGTTLKSRSTIKILSEYFDAFKDVAIFSFKDKIKIMSSIFFMRKYLVEQMAKLVKDIEKNFKDIKISDNVTNIYGFFDKLSKLNISSDFEKQRESLEALESFLFGSKLSSNKKIGKFFRYKDRLLGETSILGIIARLNKENELINNSKTIIDNFKNSLIFLKQALMIFTISDKDIIKQAKILDIINNEIISSLINISDKDNSKITEGIDILTNIANKIIRDLNENKLDKAIQALKINKKKSLLLSLMFLSDILISTIIDIGKKQNSINIGTAELSVFAKSISEISSLDEILNKLNIFDKEHKLDSLETFKKYIEFFISFAKNNKTFDSGVGFLMTFADNINETFTNTVLNEVLDKLNINDQDKKLKSLEILEKYFNVFITVTRKTNVANKGIKSFKTFINTVNSEFKSLNIKEALDKLNISNINQEIINFDVFIQNLIDLIENIKDNEDVLSNISILSKFNKTLIEEFKTKSLEESLKTIIISKNILDNIENTYKLIKSLKKISVLLSSIDKLKFTNESVTKISSSIENIINSINKIDENKLNAAISIINKITKFILITASTIIIGAYLTSKIGWRNISEFSKNLILLIASIGLLIYVANKVNITENKIKYLSSIFKEIGKFLLMSSFILITGSLLISKVGWEELGRFGAGLVGTLLLVAGLLRAFNNINIEKIKNAKEIFVEIGKFLLISSLALIAGSLLMSQIGWEELGKFGAGLFGILVLVTGLLYVFDDVDIKKIKSAKEIFVEIGKFLLITSTLLIISSLIIEKAKIRFESIATYVASIMLLNISIGFLIEKISEEGITKTKIDNASKLFMSIGLLIAAISVSFIGISLLANKINFSTFLLNLGMFAISAVAYVGFVALISYLLTIKQFNKKIEESMKLLKEMSLIVLLLSSSLLLVSVASSITSIGKILIFSAMIVALIAAVSIPLYFVKSPAFKKATISGKSLSHLVLLVSGALLLGALIVQLIPASIIMAFGALLSLLIITLSVPLLALSLGGKAILQGGKDLGQLVLYATIGLGLGALFMMIPGMKEKIKEFSDVYIGFLFKLLLAVGLCSFLAKNGFKDIKEVSKIITMSTAVLLLGGTLFLLFPKLKDAVNDFALTLALFIGSIVITVGIASLIGKEGLKYMKQISLLIVVATGSLLLAAYLMKNDPNMFLNILGFTVVLLLLVGGLTMVAKLLAKTDNLWKSLAAMGVIMLVILGATLIFEYIKNNLIDIDLLKLGGIALTMLLILGVFLAAAWGIGWLVLEKHLIKYVGAGILAIGIAGLLLWGISYIFKYIKDNLMDYDIGKLWAVTGSMMGILALLILEAGAIGAIIAASWGVIGIAIGVGALVMIGAGLLLWGMAWLFGQVLKIDKEYDFIGNGGGKNYKESKIHNIIDTLFDATEHILLRLYNLQTGDNSIVSFIKGIPIVGGLVGTIADAFTLFPNLAVAAAGIMATTGICKNLAMLTFYMKLVGDNPKKDIDKAADMIEALLGIYNDPEILEQIEAAEDHENLLQGMMELSKTMGKVIYDISLGIKNFSELRVEEIDQYGKPTGKFRQFREEDFESAAKNIANIITCVGGSIMALFGIGPYAEKISLAQKTIAKEMLETVNTGIFGLGGKKTKFALVLEGTTLIGDIIKKIAKGVIEWNKLPENFDYDAAANNIKTIITTVGGAILGLLGIGPDAANTSEEQKAVAKEMIETVSTGIFGLGGKKTKFQMVMEASEILGDVIKKIAEGVMEWSKIPPEIFSKEGANTAQDNIASIITTIGGAIMRLYTGEGLDGVQAETAKEMFDGGPFYDRSNNKFSIVAKSVSKLGTMISNIMEGVQSYANLRIPTKYDNEGKPIEWKPMSHTDFMLARINIGKLIMTLGEAITNVANGSEFEKFFAASAMEKVSKAILNVSGILDPIANTLYMYATGKFPILKYVDGKLVTDENPFDVTTNGGINIVANAAKENITAIINALAESIAVVYNNKNLKFLKENKEEVANLTESLNVITNTINTMFESLAKIIAHEISYSSISAYISQPFNEFIKKMIYPEDKDDHKYRLFKANKDGNLSYYVEAIEKLASGIFTAFNTLQKIVELATQIKPNINDLYEVYDSYEALYSKMAEFHTQYNKDISISFTEHNANLQAIIDIFKQIDQEDENKINILKEGISKLFAVIAGIKSNRNFEAHNKTLKNYVENTNKLNLIKIRSLTNLVNAINSFGDKFGNIDDFTNAIVEKLTESLEHLTGSLTEAKTTILSADKLHKNREKLIKESVKNITELMDKELTVNIKEERQEMKFGNVGSGSEGDEYDTDSNNYSNTGGESYDYENEGETQSDNKSPIKEKLQQAQQILSEKIREKQQELRQQSGTTIKQNIDANDIGNTIAAAILRYFAEHGFLT